MANKRHSGKLTVLFLILSVLASAFIYRDSFSAYFFQDDWFSLRISRVANLVQFFQLLVPRSDVIYFRPLGMQIPFFIIRSLFGINPLPFHILIFATHALNTVLVFFLIYLLTKDKIISAIGSFLYSISAVHYIPMFWPATYAFILGPAFFFLSFILFILSEQKKGGKYYFLSVLTFLSGLLTNEMVVVFPAVLLFYQIFFRKRSLMKLFPYLVSTIFLLVLRFFAFPAPIRGAYEVGFGKELLSNLRAYFLWSFNWPEEMKAQFITFLRINPQFIKDFSWYYWSFLITLFISILFMLGFPLIAGVWQKKRYFISLFVFCGGWFFVGLLPVMFFTQHSFSYYLPISLVSLMLFVSSMFKYLFDAIYKMNKLLGLITVFLFLANWIYSSYVTVDFNSKIHWAPRRSALAKNLITEAKQNYPIPAKQAVFINNSSENKLALNDQDALKVVFGDDNIITVYGNP